MAPRFAYSWKFVPGRFPPGRREQETGSLLVWENRSSARARTRKQPQACEAECWHKQGTRLARRSRGWQGNARKAKEQSSAFRAFLCVGVRLAPRFAYSWKFGAGFCPAGFLPAAGNRSRASSLLGKTGARRGRALGNRRVRARRGEKTNTVRDLLTAGVPAAGVTAGAGQRRFSHRRRRGSSGRSGGRCGPCTRRGRAPQTGGRDRCPPRAG